MKQMGMMKSTLACGVVAVMGVALVAQAPPSRALSGRGQASTQVGGEWVKGERASTYQGGKWIDVSYGRPMLRQRAGIFGTGADYGKTLNAGAPLWRTGADVSTRFKTEAALSIGGKDLPAGEYTMFIGLAEKEWTLVLSNWAAQQKYDPNNKAELWGAYNYTPDKDVLRAPMKVDGLPFSLDEFTIAFLDLTKTGGRLAVMWDKTMGSVGFTVK
jgi:hypothetical protein